MLSALRRYRRDRSISKARKKEGFPAKPVAYTGRTIDMMKSMWGWSIGGFHYVESTDSFRVHGWCTPRPKPGDQIKVNVKGEPEFFFVLNVEYVRDPDDMFFANLEVPARFRKSL
jgi:hypothetical protein